MHNSRVLAIDPGCRGFGYAVLEGPKTLVDWGINGTPEDKTAQTCRKVRRLIKFYSPEILVLEDFAGDGSRRCLRVQLLIGELRRLAASSGVRTAKFSRADIQTAIVGPRGTKREIALALGHRFPELAPYVPPRRRPWMGEDYRMNAFDAVSLAVTFNRLEA